MYHLGRLPVHAHEQVNNGLGKGKMKLNEKHIEQLAAAISKYDYPLVAYDFGSETVKTDFRSYLELEEFIRSQLLSDKQVEVKNGLSNVVFWGYATSKGRQKDRVKRFRSEVTDQQILDFSKSVRKNSIRLRDIAECNLPQFSKVSFISKILMFIDPTKYVTLDLQLSKIKKARISTSFRNLTIYPTCIPVTGQNEAFYSVWCSTCCHVAREYFATNGIRGVDVERGVFTMIRNGHVETAAGILNTFDA